MHIVILVGNYYPNYSAVGNCAKNFSEVLAHMGHNVEIISQRTSLHETQHVSQPQSIYRIETLWLRCIVRGNEPGMLNRYCNLLGRAVRYLQSVWQRHNIKWDIVKAYIQQLFIIQQHNPIDVIVPFCFPFEGVVAATRFKRTHCQQVKVVPYLFDRFASSDALHRTQWNRSLKMKAHVALEQQTFALCTKVLMMPSWHKHVHTYYPDLEQRFTEVEHPLLVPIQSSKDVAYDSSCTNIVFTGSLLKVIHTPFYSFNSLIVAIKQCPNIRVHLYARGNCSDDIRNFEHACPEQVIYHGSVDVETAHAAMQAADVLLSIGNSNITQMASKNFEYVATGSPVIHFYCDEKDPVNDLLRKMGNCLLLSQYETAEHNGHEIVKFLASHPQKHNFNEVANIIPEALPETTAKKLMEVVK